MERNQVMATLKFTYLPGALDAVCAQAAKRELDWRNFLTEALNTEWRGRHLSGVESRLKIARLPWVKTLEQFDFSFQPTIERKRVRQLSTLACVERAENLILLGPPGVGKTHLAVALGIKAVEAGHRVLFLSLDALLNKLKKARDENRLERQLQQWVYPKLLTLDEIGYLPWAREDASLLFRLIQRRYERGAMLLTSNKGFVDCGERCLATPCWRLPS